MRSQSKDTRLLVAGVVAFLALVVYLGVAFASTHTTTNAATLSLWTPYYSRLVPLSRRKNTVVDVQVLPIHSPATVSSYGAVVETFVPDPTPGRTYTIGVWLKGSTPGKIGVELNEFRPGVSRYPLETTVPATPTWRHFTFSVRVKGRWLGLAVYIYRLKSARQSWFAIRDLT